MLKQFNFFSKNSLGDLSKIGLHKQFFCRVKKSLFITLITLLHLFILLSVRLLESSLESIINPECF